MANIELKAYRKVLVNFVYYNFLFGYTLTETIWLNRAGASAHGELTNVAMMQLCSSTEFITWVGLILESLNTGRFANESVRQRPVRQRMKSIRQRRMSVRQR